MATANSKTTVKQKAKPRGKPFKRNDPATGEKDERINRAGAPARGASLKEILDFYDQLTPDEIAEMLPPGELQAAYKRMPKGIAMKHLKAIRINAAIMFDPTPGLVNIVNDRTDGKVPDEVNHKGSLTVEGLKETLKKVYGGNTSTGNKP